MAYLRTWGDIQAWMQDNGIIRWNISRTQEKQDNNNVFVYDKDKSADENKLICERALDRFAGDVLYLVGWRTGEARTGGFSATILYDKQGAQTDARQAQVSGFGLYGIDGEFDRNGLITDITNRVRNEYDRLEIQRLQKQLDDERKQLRDEQREFEKEKIGTIGILVDKFAPYIKAVASKHFDLPKVAGLDSEGDVQAARIRAAQQEQQTQEQTAEENVFTDEEAEELFMLLERFKKVEPDYLQLIKTVVEMAERGDSTYTMAKQFLLK